MDNLLDKLLAPGTALDRLKEDGILNVVKKTDGSFVGNSFTLNNGEEITAAHVARENPDLGFQDEIGSRRDVSRRNIGGTKGFDVSEAMIGSDVYVLGINPKGNTFSFHGILDTAGPIYGKKMELIVKSQPEGGVVPGMSGSAILNREGKAVGVLVEVRTDNLCHIEPIIVKS